MVPHLVTSRTRWYFLTITDFLPMGFSKREMGLAAKSLTKASQALGLHISPSLQVTHPLQACGIRALLGHSFLPCRHIQAHHSSQQREVTKVHNTEEVSKTLVGGMAAFARAIPVKGDTVEILETPSQFYEVLKQGVRNARERVVIASLYIGTGILEQELVGALYQIIA